MTDRKEREPKQRLPFLSANITVLIMTTILKMKGKIIMEKVINFDAIKANRAEMKEKRAEKKAERKAKKEAAKTEKKPIGKTLGIAGTYVAAVGAGAAAAVAVIQAMARSDAPIEIAAPESPVVEQTVVPDVEVGEA